MQYIEWVKQAVNRLSASDSAKRDAEILLEHVTGRSRTYLLHLVRQNSTLKNANKLNVFCNAVRKVSLLPILSVNVSSGPFLFTSLLRH